ncbi:MAG TPA: hypothetical protein VK053_11305, partial [Jiangellaceae bacterium]|nr:hypothetical protein [Jiangellaceae bacterium]
LAEGTIDIVATDHAPHAAEDKDCEWAAAAFGMLGLETALSIVQHTMVDTGMLDWSGIARVLSETPAHIGRCDSGPSAQGRPLQVGEPANIVVYDPSTSRTISPTDLVSRSANTPVAGMSLPGRVRATFLRGRPTVLDEKPTEPPGHRMRATR